MTIENMPAVAGRQARRPAWRHYAFRNSPQLNFDIPDALLVEVDFKWLMTGHGWWVDSARFERDPPYAAELLRCATESDSAALRVSAATLLAAGHGCPGAT